MVFLFLLFFFNKKGFCSGLIFFVLKLIMFFNFLAIVVIWVDFFISIIVLVLFKVW